MSTMNPYEPPQAYGPVPNFAQEANADYSSALSLILEAMQRTRPWITMFAVLSFIGGAFLVLGSIGMFFAGAAAGAAAGGPALFFGPGLGLLYLFFSAFYFVIGWLLWSYRTSIGGFLASGGSAGLLAAALDRQASFWKFVGILSLVGVALYAVLIVVGVGAAVSGGFR